MVDADVIVVGAGLAGLVAAAEAAEAGRRVLLLDQEPEQSLGGQAWWSFGGLFFVDSPEQRRLRVRDSLELAWRDWVGTAGFDRAEDEWPKKWARAYVEWAATEKQPWLRGMGHSVVPGRRLGRARRVRRRRARQLGAPVPHHLGDRARGGRAVREAGAGGGRGGPARVPVPAPGRRAVTTDGVVTGVSGAILEPSDVPRGMPSSRTVVGEFELSAQAVIVTSGGIGGNHDLVREAWPERLGTAPAQMLSGVPEHVDGRMIGIAEKTAGASVINRDRMWHYVEGIENWNPVWPMHGIRILPGPSSLWLDATGKRLPQPLYPGFDTLGTCEYLRRTGYDYSWFILTKKIIAKEFALSGSEQNPDLTGRDRRAMVTSRFGGGDARTRCRRSSTTGRTSSRAGSLRDLVSQMNALTGGEPPLSSDAIRGADRGRDADATRSFGKDPQVGGHQAGTLLPGRPAHARRQAARAARPGGRAADRGPAAHADPQEPRRPAHRPVLPGAVGASGQPVPGLYAAGEAAGFGGGGMHGYRSLEGTFLGGCLFSGRIAGRAAAAAVA